MENIRQLTYADYVANTNKYPLSILLDNITSPSNVGMIFRIADTLGAQELVLCGTTAQPPKKDVHRAARGAERHVPFSYADDALEAVAAFKKKGFTIIALEITNHSIDLKKSYFDAQTPVLLIAGSEDKGIQQAVLETADTALHIPTVGFSLSMNVATSVAVAVYEITKQMAQSCPPLSK